MKDIFNTKRWLSNKRDMNKWDCQDDWWYQLCMISWARFSWVLDPFSLRWKKLMFCGKNWKLAASHHPLSGCQAKNFPCATSPNFKLKHLASSSCPNNHFAPFHGNFSSDSLDLMLLETICSKPWFQLSPSPHQAPFHHSGSNKTFLLQTFIASGWESAVIV